MKSQLKKSRTKQKGGDGDENDPTNLFPVWMVVFINIDAVYTWL